MPGESAANLAAIASARIIGEPSRIAVDVTHDSSEAGPGILFAAVKGRNHDGHDFVGAAVDAGTEVVLVSREMATPVTQIIVENPRRMMGPIASAVHGDPSASIDVIGVTGTNGKTTVTHYVESIANSAGLKAGLIGTIRTGFGDSDLMASARTTPEAPDFQRLLARMRDGGAEIVAAEVSSHALDLDRVRGTRFAVAAFTNLSQDHLDFHGDMASYRAAKERLFQEYDVGSAVINVDDPVGRDIAGWVEMPVTSVGLDGDIDAINLVTGPGGSSFDLRFGTRRRAVETSILGSFNVKNLVLAAACCLAAGVDADSVVDGAGRVSGVPGRFELVSGSAPVTVIVDYAHTPEGIEMAIAAGRRLTPGKIIVVVGAGGDRDRVKRPLMGAAAGNADLVFVTNDNPRSEDPSEIAESVVAGVSTDTRAIIELDRRRAISAAIGSSSDGDLVLILGKGHETTQEVGGSVVSFDDRLVARELLSAAGSRSK